MTTRRLVLLIFAALAGWCTGAVIIQSNETLDSSIRAADDPSSGFKGSKNRLIQHVSLQSSSTSPRGYLTLYDDYVTLAGNLSMVMTEMVTTPESMPKPGLVWTVDQVGQSDKGVAHFQLRNNVTRTCLGATKVGDLDYPVVGQECNATDANQHWRLLSYMTAYGSVVFFEIQHVNLGGRSPWCVRVPSASFATPGAVLDGCAGGQGDMKAQTYFFLVPLPF